jgi:hypothetical protein
MRADSISNSDFGNRAEREIRRKFFWASTLDNLSSTKE